MTLLDAIESVVDPVVDPCAQSARNPGPAKIRTCRLTIEDARGDVDVVLDLGRVVHEVEAGEWFEELPDLDHEPGGVSYVVTLWLETAAHRWPLDDRLIPRWLADVLVENRLDELIATARA